MIKKILTNFIQKKPCEMIPEARLYEEEIQKLEELREKILKIYGRSFRIRQVDAGSCNACEWECTALTNPFYDIQRYGIDFVASPRHADAILVTGPISRQMQLALIKTYKATPSPKLVIACGDCTIDGGIFKDSYAVTNGLKDIIPVDIYIPGCPPTPMDIISHLVTFLEKVNKL